MRLALELESERVAPGKRVAGRVNVLEGGPSRSLTLTLSFHERTPDYSATPFSSVSVVHEGELLTGQTIDFDFTLPAEAPPSFKSEHAELWWELDIHADEPGFDTTVRRRLEVVVEPPVRATFACSLCGEEAGVIRLHADGGRTEVRRERWPGVLIQPLSAVMLEPLEAALVAGDVRAIFGLEPELTPFYCPSCRASYCSGHWDWWDVWDDEFSGWRDSVRGRCPRGHERMLED